MVLQLILFYKDQPVICINDGHKTSPEARLTWNNKARPKGNLLILIEEIVRVAVEDHAADRLQREEVLRPGLGDVEGVKVELVLVRNVHDLDKELPFRVLACCNTVVEVLGGMAMVGTTHLNGLLL